MKFKQDVTSTNRDALTGNAYRKKIYVIDRQTAQIKVMKILTCAVVVNFIMILDFVNINILL